MVVLVGLSWWCCNTIALCKEINGLSIVRVGENPKLGEKLGQCGTLFRGSKRLATADELQDEAQLEPGNLEGKSVISRGPSWDDRLSFC